MKRMLSLMFLLMSLTVYAAESKLYIYNWSEYLPNEVIQKFKAETGIKVVYSTYDSNEAMYAKIKLTKGSGYDLIVPSTYYLSKMRSEGLIGAIDKSKLTNYKNLDETLLGKPFDPKNEYSVPYLWGSTGISYNAKYVKGNIDSWSALFDQKYAKKILLTDDVREVFHVALRLLGYSGNDTNEQHIKLAYEKLKPLIKNVKVFNSESPKVPYINEEVYIGMNFNGESFMASKENNNIKYIYPKEGVILWMDSFAIPKNAKNIDNAHKFINFVLRPDISKIISEKIGYATPNKAAMPLLDGKIRNNPTIYPSKDIVDKGEFQLDIGASMAVYQKYWELLKTTK